MDVTEVFDRLKEPMATSHAKLLFDESLSRLDPAQAAAMTRWGKGVPMQPGVLSALRSGELDIDALERHAIKLDRTRDRVLLDARVAALPQLLDRASRSPAVASALVWFWLSAEPDLASHIVQNIRERAGLPGLRRAIERGEPRSLHGERLHVAWFADRQLDDLALWIEHIPASTGETLAASIRNTEAQRATGIGARFAEIIPFARQAASFLLHLSRRDLDPLGFSLSGDARLEIDPALPQRLEIAAWARRSRRSLTLRGQMLVLSIDVQAPWPLVVELIACELGRGATQSAGLMLRLRGEIAAPSRTEAPLFLYLPTESVEERGARFERWLSFAYTYAVDEWRAWC